MFRILVGAGILALAATGCSGAGQAAGTPSAHSSSPSAAAYHRAAQCIRQHGAPNFPDPVQNPQTGRWDLPPGTADPPQSAKTACRSIIDQISDANGKENTRPLSAADMAKARQHSACMRQHGLADFPDPDAYGTVHLPRRYEALGKRGIVSQLMACQRYVVPGAGMTTDDSGNG